MSTERCKIELQYLVRLHPQRHLQFKLGSWSLELYQDEESPIGLCTGTVHLADDSHLSWSAIASGMEFVADIEERCEGAWADDGR